MWPSIGLTKWEILISIVQAVHLFINIAATMILGCSNTYQQLVTALKVDEIRWALSKRGDSKVGTNSPWSINHKREGKTKYWLCWLLLISTSIVSKFSQFRNLFSPLRPRTALSP
jgi:hypothetical protein